MTWDLRINRPMVDLLSMALTAYKLIQLITDDLLGMK